MAYIKVPVSTPSDIPAQQQPHPQPQQHQQHHLHDMPNHIWHSHPLHSPSSSPAAVSDAADPLTSSPPHLAPLWPPADLPAYDLPSSSLPNLPSIPHIRPRTPQLPISSNNNDNSDPSADTVSLFRSFLDFRISDPPHDSTISNDQPNNLLHRSASLQPNPFATSTTRHHHSLHHQQHQQNQHQRPSSARMASELRSDSSLSHFLNSSAGLMSLHASSSPSDQSVYSQALAASATLDLPSRPVGSPILRPSSVPPSSSPQISPSPLAMGAIPPPNQAGPRIKNELYKTEICRTYAESGGYCKYGAKCQFAHGPDELRPVRRHPRYKTKLCRNFVTTGSCPYESRCRFIHDPKQTSEHVAQAAVNQSLNSASAGALGHRAHFVSGQPSLMNAKNQHLVDPHDRYAYKLRLFESSLNAAQSFESLMESMNADQRSGSSQPVEYQMDRPSALPASQIDFPSASAFHEYPDNVAFHNRIMQLSGADDLRFPPADFSDRSIGQASQQVSKPTNSAAIGEGDKIIGSPFVSASAGTHESLFSNADINNHVVHNSGSDTKGSLNQLAVNGADFVEGSTDSIPATSPTSRSRLSVFRNMVVDDNAP